MTLEDLKAFIKAYETKSLSAAARQLDCTQGAVAQHVKRLERELDGELFVRAPRGVLPTETGDTLYKGACLALNALHSATEAIRNKKKAVKQRLRLAVSNAFASGPVLRPTILTMHQASPEIELEIVAQDTATTRIEAVLLGRADIAMVPAVDLPEKIETLPAIDVELVLWVNKHHKFAKRKRLLPADLADINYIAQSESSATFQFIRTILNDNNVALQPTKIIEDPATAALMVELGKGETFVPAGIAKKFSKNGLAVGIPLPWLPTLPIVWAARSFADLPEAANLLMQTYDKLNNKSKS